MPLLQDLIGDTLIVRRRKRILVVLIAFTSVAPLLFLDLAEPSTSLVVFKILAKTGSLVGTALLAWQFLLGFRGTVSSIVIDLVWVVNLHKRLGQAAAFLILLHPIFITLYYLEKFDLNLMTVDPRTTFGSFVLLGMVAFLLLAVIFVTSVPLRKKIRTGWWFYSHLSSYLLLPLVLVHSFAIGMTVIGTPLRYPWVGLAMLMGIFYIFRTLFRLGLFSRLYRIVRTRPAADRITDITMRPIAEGSVCPCLGQFVYIRRGKFSSARPFTVSDYNDSTTDLSITIKAQGGVSSVLQSAATEEIIGVDGPYGVFTWEAVRCDRPIIMVAGGIGITPFKRVIRILEKNRQRPAWLFYGVKRTGDIVYKEELDASTFVKVVYVLNDEPTYPGEKGVVTVEMMRKYVDRDINECEFLICGPPVMITKLEAGLVQAGVLQERIHHELFGW